MDHSKQISEFRVIHKTEYSYTNTVSRCYNIARIHPMTTEHQRNLITRIYIDPPPSSLSRTKDYFGNTVFHFSVEDPHQYLSVKTESELELFPPAEYVFLESPPWESIGQLLKESDHPADLAACEFTLPSPFVAIFPEFQSFTEQSFLPGRPVLDAVMAFTRDIYENFDYDPVATTIHTPLQEVFRKRHGVCQDFAHFALSCLRLLKIPAIYVSGYIETHPPQGQEKLTGSDATHAWIAVYSPDSGWVHFDPTNGKGLTDEYILTATGRDFVDVSPIKGVMYGGGKHKVSVAVDVIRKQK